MAQKQYEHLCQSTYLLGITKGQDQIRSSNFISINHWGRMDLSTNRDLRKLGGCTPQVAKQPLRDIKL